MALLSLASVVPENAIRFLGHDTHAHDCPHLVYVALGTAELTIDGGVPFTLRRGEAAWLAPHMPHSTRVIKGGMVLGPMLDSEMTPGGRMRVVRSAPALVEIMTTMLGAAPNTDEQISRFRSALGGILAGLSRQYFPVAVPSHPSARALARDALNSPLMLSQLAERHHMSPRQIQRVFVEETGFSFSRWRSRARMNAAIAHLNAGGPLPAAARMAGFATRSGLVRALSRETGIPESVIAADPVESLNHHEPAPA